MLARERTIWLGLSTGLGLTVLGGCVPTPDEVASGLTSDPASSASGASTDSPPESTADGSATVASADGTSSGNASATGLPLDDSGTTTGEPPTTSSSSEGPGSSSSGGPMESSGGSTSTGGTDGCHPLLAEALCDPNGGNGTNQWIRLYNPCPDDIELTGYSLGWGGTDYAAQGADLSGTIAAGECFLLGGPTSNPNSYNPVFDLVLDFSADLQIGDSAADGIALFADVESNIAADTIPLDAVIYGGANTNELLDSEGNTPDPHVDAAPQSQSLRRTALDSSWEIEPNPTPNECPML